MRQEIMGFGVFSGISWTIRKQCASRCRQITTQTPCHSILTGRVLFLTPSQQYQSTKDTWMGSHNDKCTISLLNGRCSRHQRSTSRHLLAVPRFRLAVGGSQLLARCHETHYRILSGIQRAAQTVLGVYLERTYAFSALTLLVGRQEGHSGLQNTAWRDAGVVVCLERGADLHMAQLIPVPLTVSCSSKIQIGYTFLVPAHPGSPGQCAVKRVCVCVRTYLLARY